MTVDWWTLGLQTVNIAILIWLLQRFFWKPIAGMIAERHAAAQKDLSDARIARDQAQAELTDIVKTRAGFATEREQILAEARAEAERLRATKAAEATQQAAALVAAAQAAVAKDQQAAVQAWKARSADLGVDIAKRLATRLDGAVVRQAFLDWSVAAIRALPEATRKAATRASAPLEATSASPLDAEEQRKVQQSLDEAFGAPLTLVFKTDPSLIAGLEIRGDHLLVSNSWRADLAQILAELAHDQ